MEPTAPAFMVVAGIFFASVFSVVFGSGIPLTLTLQRTFQISNDNGFAAAKVRDMSRHRRVLQNVVNFPVAGSADPFSVGLYYTTLKLGSPPQEYYVQIDSGSDALWVNCAQCNGCPTSSGLKIKLRLYDPQKSTSSSPLSCSDSMCVSAMKSSEATCVSPRCTYTFQYGDGSETSGSYVSDDLTFDAVLNDGSTTSLSAKVTFGCSTEVRGLLETTEMAVDGIMGFGQNALSIVSQLASQKMAPNAFSHCLIGSESGGGILVLGEIVDPGIVYTPLVASKPHYNVYLESIAVKGQTLHIDPSVFSSEKSETILDSGTTLAYFPEEAYNTFVHSIMSSVSADVKPFISNELQCFETPNSVEETFPPVSLNFKGASMTLKRQDYLLEQPKSGDATVWCIGWQKIQGSITILGDIVLKDKIFVFDLDGQRVGWMTYDCSQAVNVSGHNLKFNGKKSSNRGSPTLILDHNNLIFYSIGIAILHYYFSFCRSPFCTEY